MIIILLELDFSLCLSESALNQQIDIIDKNKYKNNCHQ